ncbi:membrane magnesium transporter family protein [Aspergillus homomorphus CBS 101889]|uniref:Magnesium transporter n=1 Tax=Aspergillus homomorphus (strain CBS 101889) TaxID=1450537 RepID=A0A395HWB5_ASPHC|nr:hypothetical protein BO97DRAFT_394344 [Aspergillus homomorphus CBS 101889]RAL10514.1 hypothetical protein BO97DRAFT_394344 [Aspergillus homomorphus CBS 101889]
MGFLSRLLTLIGLVLLAHAGYSAHEQTLLTSSTRTHLITPSSPLSPSSSTTAKATANPLLPADIIIEALVSLVIVSAGLVLGTEQLKPISWSEWAGQIEREGKARHPYRRLEERYGFWDVRTKRKEFADWIRGDGMGKVGE